MLYLTWFKSNKIIRSQKTSADGGSTISDKGPVLAMVMTWAAVVYATLTLLYWFSQVESKPERKRLKTWNKDLLTPNTAQCFSSWKTVLNPTHIAWHPMACPSYMTYPRIREKTSCPWSTYIINKMYWPENRRDRNTPTCPSNSYRYRSLDRNHQVRLHTRQYLKLNLMFKPIIPHRTEIFP